MAVSAGAFAVCISACSTTDAPSPLSLGPSYHLRAVDGVPLPIALSGSETLDSGHVLRLRGDTVRIDTYSHSPPANGNPGLGVIALGTWSASQNGNMVVLFPVIASAIDTAFLSGDTLTLHEYSSHRLQIEIFVAP